MYLTFQSLRVILLKNVFRRNPPDGEFGFFDFLRNFGLFSLQPSFDSPSRIFKEPDSSSKAHILYFWIGENIEGSEVQAGEHKIARNDASPCITELGRLFNLVNKHEKNLIGRRA
jgi:hypothetical protein